MAGVIRVCADGLAYVVLYAVFLFLPSPTLRWSAAWVLLGVTLVTRAVIGVSLYRRRPELLTERARLPLQRGQSTADRILLPAYMATFTGVIVFTSWDRWHALLLGAPPLWWRPFGLVLIVGGLWLVYVALRANNFAVTVVRHQPERGHIVVATGPYRVVRHPMYAGLIAGIPGIGLWLGSAAGILASVVPVGVLMARIVFEERMLRRSLSGYARYAAEVRWRLLPRVW